MTDAGKQAWIEWTGGENPAPGQMVQWRTSDGWISDPFVPDVLDWREGFQDAWGEWRSPVAYRLADSGEAGLAGYEGEAEVNNSLPTQGGGAGDLLRRSIAALRGHIEAIQAGKRGDPVVASRNPITDCINSLPEIVRWLDAAEFEADAAFEEYEGRLSALQAAPSEGGEPVASKWGSARNLFVAYAEKFTNATRYEEASAIADKAARELDDLYARPPAPSEELLVGWVVVPREPTRAMIDAAYEAHEKYEEQDSGSWLGLVSAYKAMLAAAPAPDAIRGGEGALRPSAFVPAGGKFETEGQPL